MKKTRKFNILTLIGALLIISGGSILIGDYITKQNRNKETESYKQHFLDGLDGIDEVDPDTTVEIDIDVHGILEIDRIDLSLPVANDGNFENLYSVLVAYNEAPTPPTEGNYAIAGHNGACGDTCGFKNLNQVESGDLIRYIDRENSYVYEVYENIIVDKSDTWILNPKDDETTLTLITCRYPSWTHPDRLIVHAKLIEVVPNVS